MVGDVGQSVVRTADIKLKSALFITEGVEFDGAKRAGEGCLAEERVGQDSVLCSLVLLLHLGAVDVPCQCWLSQPPDVDVLINHLHLLRVSSEDGEGQVRNPDVRPVIPLDDVHLHLFIEESEV